MLHHSCLKSRTDQYTDGTSPYNAKQGGFRISEVLDKKDYQFDAVHYRAVSVLTGAIVTFMSLNLMPTIRKSGSDNNAARLIQLIKKELIKDNEATHGYSASLAEAKELESTSVIDHFFDKGKEGHK